jgi:hypothetical protein
MISQNRTTSPVLRLGKVQNLRTHIEPSSNRTFFLSQLYCFAHIVHGTPNSERAREHRLDVPCVTIVTAERTIEGALDTLPSSVKGPLPDLAKAQVPTTTYPLSLPLLTEL